VREDRGAAVSDSSPREDRGAGPTVVTLARLALRLYPLAYQRRYGDEMRMLLEDRPPHARTVLDLVRGALRAHLRPGDAPAGLVDASDRIRATASGVLLCWIVFAMAGFAFYKTTEERSFSNAGHVHPLLRDAHLAVQAIAVIASICVVLGAAPLIAAALARARQDRAFRRTVALPLLPLVVFALATAVFVAIAHGASSHHGSTGSHAGAVVWMIAGLLCGVACGLACRSALFATPVKATPLRTALASGMLVTLAMLLITVAVAVYAIALAADASRLAGTANGPFQLLSTSASLIVQVIVMAAAAALAAVTARRGWRARSALGAAAP
jgi:hypothetical protein